MSTDEPDKGEQKTERFNMFMSPSEMQAIDDWAWKNRIRSKSEAVRRLVQIGLAFDVQAAKDGSQLLMQASNELILPMLTLESLIEDADLHPVDDIVITDAINEVEEKIKGVQRLLGTTIHTFWNQLRLFNNALKDPDLQEALSDLAPSGPTQNAEGDER
jgi:hypothetical protein